MAVRIANAGNALRRIQANDLVISFYTEGIDYPVPAEHLLYLNIDDDEDWDSEHAPRLADIERAFEFVSSSMFCDNLIVQCQGGISRSTALAIGILVGIHGYEIEEAWAIVFWSSGCVAWPNRLIIELCDRHLGLDGELVREIARLRANAPLIERDYAP